MKTMEIKEQLKETRLYDCYRFLIKDPVIRYEITRDPKSYTQKLYKKIMGRQANIDNPKTFTEKIQWRKLFSNNELYTICTDKVLVRDWISDKLIREGYEKNNLHFPIWYGVYKNEKEVDFDRLPNKFVIKPNHSSGKIIVCTDKSQLDREKAKREMNQWLKENYYYLIAEKQYKNIEPKLISEEFLQDNIIDYKLFCFEGEPFFSMVINENKHDPKLGIQSRLYYNDWSPTEFNWINTHEKVEFERPANWNEMLEIARVLSDEFHFVRVDLYTIHGQIYFGELTFTPTSGFMDALPYEWDEKIGEKFILS